MYLKISYSVDVYKKLCNRKFNYSGCNDTYLKRFIIIVSKYSICNMSVLNF